MGEYITKCKEAEETIRFRLKFEKTISSVSSRFVGISDINDAITDTLEDIGKLSGASRAYLFLFNEDGITMDNTHEWCAEGVNPQIENLQNCPMDMAPWWMKKLRNNETIHITDVSKLPMDAQTEREILEKQDIKSLLVLPLYISGELNGFIGFDNVIETGKWSDNDITLLRVSSQILGTALERNKGEEALQESEAKYRTLVEQSLQGIVVIQDFRIVFANKTFAKIFGYTIKELMSLPPKKVRGTIHPDDQVFVWKRFEKRLSGKQAPQHYECRGVDKRGVVRWLEIFAKRIEFQGKPAVQAIILDITNRKKAEAEIIKTKEYLQNIINSASEIIVSFDKNNRLTTWNKTAELITGYKTREIIGRPVTKLTVFDKPQELADTIKNIYNGHKKVIDKFILKTKHGTKKIIKPSYSMIKSDNGESTGILFFGRDITHQQETHGKLLNGNSYLISDKSKKAALDIFIDLTRLDYEGLFITRANPEMIKDMIHSLDIKVELLNKTKLGKFDNIADLEGLTAKIKDFSEKHTAAVILLDRVDYLITNFSFEQFVKSLYQINSLIAENKSVLLLHVGPSVLDARQMPIIEAELQYLPHQKIEYVQIEDELFDILTFMNEQNQNNSVVSFTKISREFSIARSTTAKRLKMLDEKGLIFIKKQGRSKTAYVSEKGKILLNKR